jgi:hypothetical protein
MWVFLVVGWLLVSGVKQKKKKRIGLQWKFVSNGLFDSNDGGWLVDGIGGGLEEKREGSMSM